MVEFKEIKLDGVIIPYCTNEEGVDYYPIKYVVEQFLLKGYGQIHKKENLKEFVKRYIIDFTFKGTVPQECYCMNKEGWIEYVSTIRKNKNKSDEKIKRLKAFCEFLKIEYKDETIKEYDVYTLRCIENFKSKSPKVQDKQCVKCERWFPNSINFFITDVKNKTTNICRNCKNVNWINYNSEEQYIYENYGLDGFNLYMKDRINFYKKYSINNGIINKNLNLNKVEDEETRKLIIMEIAKEMLDKNIITSETLCVKNVYKLSNIKVHGWSKVKNNELIEYCSNEDCKSRYWLYPKYTIENMTLKQAFTIFNTYIKDNVSIENIFEYKDYLKLIKLSRLNVITKNKVCDSALEFIVKFYDNKYAGYKFKLRSENYYKDKNNCIFDMKYLIEKDLKVPIEKIPLYITKYSLSKNARPLYTALRERGYYNNLFEWINDCYPNKFIETDFDINPYRSEFDSLEEAQVDEQLRSRFNNVIYNPRDKAYKIEIMNMIPDWIIITEDGCYLTEYYGMYTEGDVSSSHRLQRYQEKTAIKLDKYKSLENNGYKHLAIFPNDIRNNFEGLHKKIDKIINKN